MQDEPHCHKIVPGFLWLNETWKCHLDGSKQDCSISSANALEILQSCTKPSNCLLERKKGNLVRCLFVPWHVSRVTLDQFTITRADARLVASQWETLLQSNAVSHWLGANLESALITEIYLDRLRLLCSTKTHIGQIYISDYIWHWFSNLMYTQSFFAVCVWLSHNSIHGLEVNNDR